MNDFWRYSNRRWRWIGGTNSTGDIGNPGTKSVPSLSNYPSARTGAACWIDSQNNIFMFGGYAGLPGESGYLSDLWKYTSNGWAWIMGPTERNQSASDTPSARHHMAYWIDAADTMWMFGGQGSVNGSEEYFNQLFKFDKVKFVLEQELSTIGDYNTTASPFPGARKNPAVYTDEQSRLWIFGGRGYASNSSEGVLNDLWKIQGTYLSLTTARFSTRGSSSRTASSSMQLTTSKLTSAVLSTSQLTSSHITSMQLTTDELTTSPLTSGQVTSEILTTSKLSFFSGAIEVSPEKERNSGAIVSAVVVVMLLAIILLAIAIVFVLKRRKNVTNKPKELELSESYVPIKVGSGLASSVTEGTKSFFINYSEIKIISRVGGGFFGDVFQAKWRNALVAVKQIKGNVTEKNIGEFEGEADLMSKMRPHPNVVIFFGMCPSPICIVTEFVEKGSLHAILQGEEKLNETTQLRIIRGIASGMLHLGYEKIVHKVVLTRRISYLLGSSM